MVSGIASSWYAANKEVVDSYVGNMLWNNAHDESKKSAFHSDDAQQTKPSEQTKPCDQTSPELCTCTVFYFIIAVLILIIVWLVGCSSKRKKLSEEITVTFESGAFQPKSHQNSAVKVAVNCGESPACSFAFTPVNLHFSFLFWFALFNLLG